MDKAAAEPFAAAQVISLSRIFSGPGALKHSFAPTFLSTCDLVSMLVQANQIISKRHYNFDRMEAAERRRLGKDVQQQQQQQQQQQELEHFHHHQQAPALSPLPPLAFRFMVPEWLRQFSQSMAARLLPKAFVTRRQARCQNSDEFARV
jgi:hypothetical protein